ncbi:phosphatase PAP2 family protein [Micromonospora sp. BRA006-A]|nr:phosphatase PAP2 family protein [Micromonospora sp. BRA006-A]
MPSWACCPAAARPSAGATQLLVLVALSAVEVIAVGVARVWVGVHYPGDILAAAVIAGLCVVAVSLASHRRHHLGASRRRT